MTVPDMLIGILQTGHFLPDANLGGYSDLYARMLQGHGLTFRTWSVVDMEFPETVKDADGWLISGSRHGAYEDLPFIPPLEDFIRDINAKAVPLVGICFGHQIIAQALGGRVEKFEDGWAVGHTTYDFQGTPLALNAWHQDQVVEKPADATTVASNDFCQYAGFQYGKHIMSIQAHPEFTKTEIDALLTLRAPGLVTPERITDASSKLNSPDDNAIIADQIANFFKDSANV